MTVAGKTGFEGEIPNIIKEASLLESRYKYPILPDKPLEGQDTGSSGLAESDDEKAKIIEERKQFIDANEALLRDDKTGVGLDALLDYYKDDGDESFSKVEDIAGVLAKQVEAKAPQILGIVPPESKDIVGIQPIPGIQPQVIDPVVAKGGEPQPEIQPEPEVIKTEPVVAEAEPIVAEPKPVVGVPSPAVEVPEPDQGAGNILSELLPLISAADDKPSLIDTKPIDDLFSTDPDIELSDKQEYMIERQKKHYKEFDKNFEKNAKVAQEIYESDIIAPKYNNKGEIVSYDSINMSSINNFNEQINSMASRVKEINESIKVQLPNQPETYLSYEQDVVEQKQLVNNLMLLKEKLDNVTKLYIPDLDSQGRKTGKLLKKGLKGYKQSLKKVIDSLPKYYDLKSHKYDISQSKYENILGY